MTTRTSSEFLTTSLNEWPGSVLGHHDPLRIARASRVYQALGHRRDELLMLAQHPAAAIDEQLRVVEGAARIAPLLRDAHDDEDVRLGGRRAQGVDFWPRDLDGIVEQLGREVAALLADRWMIEVLEGSSRRRRG